MLFVAPEITTVPEAVNGLGTRLPSNITELALTGGIELYVVPAEVAGVGNIFCPIIVL